MNRTVEREIESTFRSGMPVVFYGGEGSERVEAAHAAADRFGDSKIPVEAKCDPPLFDAASTDDPDVLVIEEFEEASEDVQLDLSRSLKGVMESRDIAIIITSDAPDSLFLKNGDLTGRIRTIAPEDWRNLT